MDRVSSDGVLHPDAPTADRLDRLAAPVVDRVCRLVPRGRTPCIVGIDGRSGSGKSTLASHVGRLLGDQHQLDTTVIEGDDFYAGGTAATWDARTAEEKAASVIDWARQRDVLSDLRRHGSATWFAFDWDASTWDGDDPPMAADATRVGATPVVILEGAYSCRPELADLLDLRVLLDPPAAVRRRQLLAREGEDYRADWETRWSDAEDVYFERIVPPSWFDLVLGSGPSAD